MNVIPAIVETYVPVEEVVTSVAVLSIRSDSAEEDTPLVTEVAVLSIRSGSAEEDTMCSAMVQPFSAAQILAWEAEAKQLFSNSKACYDKLLPLFDRNFQIRQEYVRRFGWAVLDQNACAEIVKHTTGDIISICSGNAPYETYLRPLLAIDGRAIVCSDIESQPDAFMEVVTKSCVEAVEDDGTSETLFVSWPEPTVDIRKALRARRSGTLFPIVAYIGEVAGGCTGNDRFHEFLQRNYTRIKVIKIPNWGDFVIRDRVQIFKRKNEFEDLPEDEDSSED